MKRVLFVALLATAMLIAMAAPAFATDYKLTITAYYDADSDGCWDANEPVLPNVVGTAWWAGGEYQWKTDSCGWVKFFVPAGSVVKAYPMWVEAPLPDGITFPDGHAHVNEATPMDPTVPSWAKVVMRGNRCILFGIGPYPYTPPACAPCPAVPCEPCDGPG
jgi:hypothetical protein